MSVNAFLNKTGEYSLLPLEWCQIQWKTIYDQEAISTMEKVTLIAKKMLLFVPLAIGTCLAGILSVVGFLLLPTDPLIVVVNNLSENHTLFECCRVIRESVSNSSVSQELIDNIRKVEGLNSLVSVNCLLKPNQEVSQVFVVCEFNQGRLSRKFQKPSRNDAEWVPYLLLGKSEDLDEQKKLSAQRVLNWSTRVEFLISDDEIQITLT